MGTRRAPNIKRQFHEINIITCPSDHSHEPAVLLRLSHKAKNVKAHNNNDTSRKEYMFSFADMPRLVMYSATSGSEAWCGPHCVQSRFYSAGRMKLPTADLDGILLLSRLRRRQNFLIILLRRFCCTVRMSCKTAMHRQNTTNSTLKGKVQLSAYLDNDQNICFTPKTILVTIYLFVQITAMWWTRLHTPHWRCI